MAKLDRKTQKIFGKNITTAQQEMTTFNSTNGTPVFTNDVEALQTSAWEEGWFEETTNGDTRPFAEDRNAVDYVLSRQLAYIFEAGIAEWDDGTTYYTDSIVRYGSVLYISIADNNLNQNPSISGSAYWTRLTLADNDIGMIGEVRMFAGTTLPSSKWLFCRGQAISRTTYADLFNAIGTSYGVGNGSTTFNIPNFQLYIPMGLGTSGNYANLGYKFGALDHNHIVPAHYHSKGNLNIATSGSHTHNIMDNGHSHTIDQHRHSFTSGDFSAPVVTKQPYKRAAYLGPDHHDVDTNLTSFNYNSKGLIANPAITGINLINSSHAHTNNDINGNVGAVNGTNGDVAFATNNGNTSNGNPPCLCINFIIKAL